MSSVAVEGMRRSITSVFSQSDDLEAAVSPEGEFGLLVTQAGGFLAKLTDVVLHSMRLIGIEENLARIARIEAPKAKLLIALSVGSSPPQIWGGRTVEADDLVSLSSGSRILARTERPCHWGLICLPLHEFDRANQAVTGERLQICDGASIWRPPHAARRELRRLHAVAMQAPHGRSVQLTNPEAAHALEQELMHALVLCLSGAPLSGDSVIDRQQADLVERFDDLLSTRSPDMDLTMISKALGVPMHLLRRHCQAQLGMIPAKYLRLRQLQFVHRDLLYAVPGTLKVSEAAKRHGVRDLGRFAAAYRDLFREHPSATLRREPNRPIPELVSPGRTRSVQRQPNRSA